MDQPIVHGPTMMREEDVMDASLDSKKEPQQHHLTDAAQERRRKLLQAEKRAFQLERRARRRKKLSKVAKSVGNAVQKINIGKWIDDLEKDQQLADELEEMNQANREEQERKELVRQAKEICMQAIHEHLRSFLQENPDGTYEEWIQELHPDNVDEVKGTIDERFFVEDCEHQLIWTEQTEKLHQKTPPSADDPMMDVSLQSG
jgi:hypothetical protein